VIRDSLVAEVLDRLSLYIAIVFGEQVVFILAVQPASYRYVTALAALRYDAKL
jgi:hypothetical protein